MLADFFPACSGNYLTAHSFEFIPALCLPEFDYKDFCMSFWSRLFTPFSSKTREQTSHERETTEFQVLEELLRGLQKRERRQAQAFERMLLELGSKIDNVQARLDAGQPMEAISDFAESFALYYLRNHDRDESLKHVWSRFCSMLEEFSMELILDLHRPFDDTRHQACDTRHDDNHPENSILEVVRPGLIARGRIIRPAVVVISRALPRQDQGSIDI